MAYVSTERNRGATIAAVGALHAAAIYALVTGLAGPLIEIIKDPPLVGTNVTVPLPPPDTTRKQQDKRELKTPQADHTTGETVIASTEGYARNNDDFVLPPLGGDGGIGGGDVVDPPLPPKPPVETFTPKLARPLGKAGLWVTANDYPSHDLRLEHEGVTRFQLSIGADGKVLGCEVTVSSGYASLDAAACNTLKKRGRFTAATDAAGAAVPGTYSSAVRWEIPKN